MSDASPKDAFDPSLNIITLDPYTREPIVFHSSKDKNVSIIAIGQDGRIVYLPATGGEGTVSKSIVDRIGDVFPSDKDISGNVVGQFLAAGVAYVSPEKVSSIFISEVWGFREPFGELDDIHRKLFSLLGMAVGDENYTKVQTYLTSDPVRIWVNELIGYLKGELHWTERVKTAIDGMLP
jgi:hypothetical protein